MKISTSSKNILLFDSSLSIEKLKTLMTERTFLIISFNYESHKLLQHNNIEHEISDNFINEKDLSEIQKTSYDFTKWCNDTQISHILDYDGINLGNLFLGEFRLFLVPFLKKFLEINKIHKKFPDENYFVTTELFPFISFYGTKVEKIVTSNTINEKNTHTVKYGFNLYKKHFDITIPEKYFKKLKIFSEIFISKFFSGEINLNKKTVLLLDFSPIRFKHFFLNIPTSNLNVVLYNRRLPPVWNYDSYSIIKNSNCIIPNVYALMDKNSKEILQKNLSIVNSQINELWNHNSYFEDFFKLNGLSFWNLLKPYFQHLFDQKISEYIYEIELTKKLFKKYQFSSILVFSEMSPNEQIVINVAKKFNIKIALIQHGLYEETPEALEYNKIGVLPTISDKFLVWGEILKKYSIDCGIKDEQIEIIGNPAYDDFFIQTKKSDLTNSFILLTTTNPQFDTISDLMFDSYLQREKAIEQICSVVTKLKKKLVIKLHPNPNEIDITNFVHAINPEITVIKFGNVLDLIKNCEIFITLNISTTILEAQISKKPTISLFVTERGFGRSELFKSGSCISVSINDFENIFTKLINDIDFRNNTIHKGQIFSNSYLSNQGTSSKKLINFLEYF